MSTDGGKRFTHPADYRIRVPPTWQKGFPCNQTLGSQFGSFEPSNIVHNTEGDGLFYATFNYISHPVAPFTSGRGPIVGDCIMRTSDLAKGGSSWQVWTGASTAWQPAATTDHCEVLSDGVNTKDSALDIKTLSYNTYLKQWIGIGDRGGQYGCSLSRDLKVWSAFVPFLVKVPQGPSAYISLLDPTDTGQTFERSGQDPYVYLTLLRTWPNFDIIRQQIHITIDDEVPAGTTNAASTHKRRWPELCAALEAVLPLEACAVNADCWGFTCTKEVFNVPMEFECDLRPICDLAAPEGPALALAVEAPGSGVGPWAFGLSRDANPDLYEPIEGLGFSNLPQCEIDAQALATGRMFVDQAQNTTITATTAARWLELTMNLGVDACCLDGSEPPICGSAAQLFPEAGWSFDFTEACGGEIVLEYR